jgi:hypothetical protein
MATLIVMINSTVMIIALIPVHLEEDLRYEIKRFPINPWRSFIFYQGHAASIFSYMPVHDQP